jgi:hypothetical protein
MTDSSNMTFSGTRRTAAQSITRKPWRAPGEKWLAAVGAGFTLCQLVLVHPGMGLGWDESVYVSQVSSHAPAAFFSAPRARGVSLLASPIASWSSSTPMLRIYLAVLSGCGLYLALRVWRGLFPARVLAVGGALFATLWVTLFYGPQAMPNLWVALGALAGVGCFLRVRTGSGGRAALGGVFAGAVVMALMRPMDAVWVALPLLALALTAGPGRRLWLFAALAAGLAVGSAQWMIEAYTVHGGLAQRLSDASRIQGGLGWNLAFADQLRSMGGRTLCRPCTGAMAHPVVTVWWYVLPVLAALGLSIAVRAGRTARTLVPLVCAASAAVPYLFLIGYAAPRFLLPAYALLAIPVADALVHAVMAPGRRRPVVVSAVVLGLAVHLSIQFAVLHRTVDRSTASHAGWARTAADLHRLGVRPPCVLSGHYAVPIAFYAGCRSAQPSGHDASTTPAELQQTAQSIPVAVLVATGARVPAHARSWPVERAGDLEAYIAPFAP